MGLSRSRDKKNMIAMFSQPAVPLEIWSRQWGSKTHEHYALVHTLDFLLTFHSNHRPVSHRFRDKRRYPSKIANFFPRLVTSPSSERLQTVEKFPLTER